MWEIQSKLPINDKRETKSARLCCNVILLSGSLLDLLFDSEDGGTTLLRNVDGLLIHGITCQKISKNNITNKGHNADTNCFKH
jgi:hypothetical protein